MEETTSRCTKAMGKGIFVNKKGLLIISSSGGEEVQKRYKRNI